MLAVPMSLSYIYAEWFILINMGWQIFSVSGLMMLLTAGWLIFITPIIRSFLWLPSLVMWFYNDGGQYDRTLALSGNFTDSNWRLYTFTWTYISTNNWSGGENRTYDLRFYENGVLNGDIDRMEIQLVSSGGFQIGGDDYIDALPIEGYYDNFQIYNKALSQTEITYLYNFQNLI